MGWGDGLGAKGKGQLMVTPEQPGKQSCPLSEGPEPAGVGVQLSPPSISLPSPYFMLWRLMSTEDPITGTAWIQSRPPSSAP